MKGYVSHGRGQAAREEVADPGTDLHILKGDVPEVPRARCWARGGR
ncbi:hypothetical protein GCM10010276_05780 [Streptomyces longisporus]|uniref:Uncharacterized protein n=1 Tax=Streptomyces longisporus TaxID=1948 RepID=A0ABP5Y5B6_STRLO